MASLKAKQSLTGNLLAKGKDGKSAFDYAVAGGFKGTEKEFIEMLASGGTVKRVNEIEPDESGNIDLGFPTEEETLVLLAESDLVNLATDENGDIFTDANGNVIVF